MLATTRGAPRAHLGRPQRAWQSAVVHRSRTLRAADIAAASRSSAVGVDPHAAPKTSDATRIRDRAPARMRSSSRPLHQHDLTAIFDVAHAVARKSAHQEAVPGSGLRREAPRRISPEVVARDRRAVLAGLPVAHPNMDLNGQIEFADATRDCRRSGAAAHGRGPEVSAGSADLSPHEAPIWARSVIMGTGMLLAPLDGRRNGLPGFNSMSCCDSCGRDHSRNRG